ncbi:MAG: hypothetical protein ACI9P5_004915, partial [Saprospiraceae bacterium]
DIHENDVSSYGTLYSNLKMAIKKKKGPPKKIGEALY